MYRELELHVRAGILPVVAIRMATLNNATFLRRVHEIGTIEKGKIADLLVVKGDPPTHISNTRNIVFVIKGGRSIEQN